MNYSSIWVFFEEEVETPTKKKKQEEKERPEKAIQMSVSFFETKMYYTTLQLSPIQALQSLFLTFQNGFHFFFDTIDVCVSRVVVF